MIDILIWIAVLIYIILKIKKRNNKATQNGIQNTVYYSRTTKQARNGSYQNRPLQNGAYPNKTLQTNNKNFAVMPEHKKVPPNVERKCVVEDRHRSENNVSGKQILKASTVPNVQRSYTDLPKQTRQEKKEKYMVAMRLYEGDHVPRGYRMVKCSYCAAENLVAHSSKGGYMCYFCHTELKRM